MTRQVGPVVVRAILFFSPTCPHCEDLIESELPPLLERYGGAFQIVGVNVLTQWGSAAYRATIARHSIPEARQGVPTVLIGSQVLVGGLEIPAELPGIIEAGLDGSGVDWPDIAVIREGLLAQGLIEPPAAVPTPPSGAPSGLDRAARADPGARNASVAAADTPALAGRSARPDSVSAANAAARTGWDPLATTPPTREAAAPGAASGPSRPGTPPVQASSEGGVRAHAAIEPLRIGTADANVPAAAPTTMVGRFRLDPVGNAFSVVVLAAMAAAMVIVGLSLAPERHLLPDPPSWVVPALTVPGTLVAAYLAWIEFTGVEAVCGPVGHCNIVQRSEYARLFGMVPVGMLGVIGYGAILTAWGIGVRARDRTRRLAVRLTWAMAAGATLFSAYLTFLEPFVIGATCAWCLSSAVIVTLLLLATTPAMRRELRASRLPPEPV